MHISSVYTTLSALGLLIAAAYIGGRLARRVGIGETIGQILGGMLAGPYFVSILFSWFGAAGMVADNTRESFLSAYTSLFSHADFFIFLFIGIVSFSIGEELRPHLLRKTGVQAVVITMINSVLTVCFISAGFFFLTDMSMWPALIAGSIGIATAPALTFVLIEKLNIEGTLKNIVTNIIVMSDILGVVTFSFLLSIFLSTQESSGLCLASFTRPMIELLEALLLGAALFVVLKLTIRHRSCNDTAPDSEECMLYTVFSQHPAPSVEIFIILTALIALVTAFSVAFSIPFLVVMLTAGVLVSNFHFKIIFDSLKIRSITAILRLMFFALIGASIRLDMFTGDVLFLILLYLFLRTLGKMGGSYIGCRVAGQDPKITAALPKLMLPQTGIAAVETIIAAEVMYGNGGGMLVDTVIPAIIVFEISGAWLSEMTLKKWKAWVTGETTVSAMRQDEHDPVDLSDLIENRVVQLMARTREEAVTELSQVLVQQGVINDIDTVVASVMERESLESTHLGERTAIPHCRISVVSRTFVVCGLLRNEFLWSEDEQEAVRTIFLIVAPDSDQEQYLNALQRVIRAVTTEGFLSQLANSRDSAERREVLDTVSDN